ncbi:MAG: hypothetical protein IJ222_09560 [Bacteroidales bacterium]|nr:hypothetical protein [Bacteroidales bacterium]
MLCAVALAIAPARLSAQSDTGEAVAVLSYEELSQLAERAHDGYDFAGAVRFFGAALQACSDSAARVSLESKLTGSRNARMMSSYATRPKVVARKNFSLKDFFLYYPLPDKSWRPSPNRLDSLGGRFSPAVYYPFGADEVFWSGADTMGVRNIMYSRQEGASWSAPEKLELSSSDDDIFPMVNGNRLYFASRGFYGVGGYDIYYCTRRTDGSWGPPRNMGFPYSSPADDFLFINSADGKYSIFASNRDCSADSVGVYVLEYEVLPVSKAVESVGELRELCSLTPADDLKKVDNKSALSSSTYADPNTALYMRKAAEVRALRDTIARFNKVLDDMRAQYKSAAGEDKEKLSVKIVVMENRLPGLQSKLVAANKDLQKTEMDFLLHGVLIDRNKVEAESDIVVVGADKSYTFTRRRFGSGDF